MALVSAQTSVDNPADLRRLRETRGVSLEQIADSTKISIRFLRAIEALDFAQLPGGIFNTSYIRQYAASIGCDEGRLLEIYRARMGIEEEPQPAARPSNGNGKRSMWRWQRSPATPL